MAQDTPEPVNSATTAQSATSNTTVVTTIESQPPDPLSTANEKSGDAPLAWKGPARWITSAVESAARAVSSEASAFARRVAASP